MKKAVTLSSKGQLVIPARVRREAGLRAGDAVEVRWESGRVVLEKSRATHDLSSLAREVRAHFAGRDLEGEILAERELERRRQKVHRP